MPPEPPMDPPLLLKTSQSTTSVSHTAEDFAKFFRSKVNKIRQTTASAPPPNIADRSCSVPSAFDDVTVEEITKIVSSAPAKHCSLDPIPTWLLKHLLPLLSTTTLTQICNASIHEGVFQANLKEAIVYPRLKKSTLNPDDMNSFRPISNLSFLKGR